MSEPLTPTPNDVEAEIRAALAMDEPGPAPEALRTRVSAVTATPPRRQSVGRVSWHVGAGLAAMVLVAVGALVALGQRPTHAPTASSAAPATTSPSATATASPEASPSPGRTTGGYRWISVDAAQFDGVGLSAATLTTDMRFLAIGDWSTGEAPDGSPGHPTTWVSADGIAWTRLPDSPAFAASRQGWEPAVEDLATGREGFVAVGMEQQADAGNADAAAWISPDGTTWTRVTVDDGVGRTMDHVIHTAHGYVAIGEARYDLHAGFGAGSAIWTSSDGRHWTRLADAEAPPLGTRLGPPVAGPGSFLAPVAQEIPPDVGGGTPPIQPVTDGIWGSTDAVHWGPIPGTPLGVREITRDTSGYVAIGTVAADGGVERPMAWRSVDGRTWVATALPLPTGLPASTLVYAQRLAMGASGLVAIGERDDDLSTVAWSASNASAWGLLDVAPILGDASVDRQLAMDGVILVVGRRVTGGESAPAVWLLRP